MNRAGGVLVVIAAVVVVASPARAGGKKQVVTINLGVCHAAFAPLGGDRVVGDASDRMELTCTVDKRWRTWDCVLLYPENREVARSAQRYILTDTGRKCGPGRPCFLIDKTGGLRVIVAMVEDIGLAVARLDVTPGALVNETFVFGVRICSGTASVSG